MVIILKCSIVSCQKKYFQSFCGGWAQIFRCRSGQIAIGRNKAEYTFLFFSKIFFLSFFFEITNVRSCSPHVQARQRDQSDLVGQQGQVGLCRQDHQDLLVYQVHPEGRKGEQNQQRQQAQLAFKTEVGYFDSHLGRVRKYSLAARSLTLTVTFQPLGQNYTHFYFVHNHEEQTFSSLFLKNGLRVDYSYKKSFRSV